MTPFRAPQRDRSTPRWLALAGAIAVAPGCASMSPRAVSPAEIPALEAQIEVSPDDGAALHRYAAALFAADRCEDAEPAASRAIDVAPAVYLGTLVLGRCLEQRERFDEALGIYTDFLSEYSEANGADAIDAQRRMAAQQRGAALARAALAAGVQDAAQEAANPDAVAVLPALVVGSPEYAALSRGLAAMMISDLDILQRFQLLERVEIEAILDELALAESALVDPATAARVGRIVRAGRTVQGTATLDAGAEDALLEAAVAGLTGPPGAPVESAGGLDALLDLEKELVLGVSEALGYVPSLAERTLVLENGTRNLAAFLAFSAGLEAEAAGDYEAAAQLFQDALDEDPDFEAARTELTSALVTEVVAGAGPGELTTLGAASEDAAAQATMLGAATTSNTLGISVLDVAGLDGEITTLEAGEPNGDSEIGSLTTGPAATGDTGTGDILRAGQIRIFFVIP